MGKTYWKGVVLPSALYGAEVIDMKGSKRNRQITKSRDSKKNKKSKWRETTIKYMNWAQIEEREIKEWKAKEIRGKIAKVVELEEWREELEKKNSLGIYRRFKKRNERGGLQWKSRINGVVGSGNKQLKI